MNDKNTRIDDLMFLTVPGAYAPASNCRSCGETSLQESEKYKIKTWGYHMASKHIVSKYIHINLKKSGTVSFDNSVNSWQSPSILSINLSHLPSLALMTKSLVA